MELMMHGATAMAFCASGLFFLRFYRGTGDRLFLWFAISFIILGLSRIPHALMVASPEDDSPIFYVVRLAAYVMIAVAIVDKNWVGPGRGKG